MSASESLSVGDREKQKARERKAEVKVAVKLVSQEFPFILETPDDLIFRTRCSIDGCWTSHYTHKTLILPAQVFTVIY